MGCKPRNCDLASNPSLLCVCVCVCMCEPLQQRPEMVYATPRKVVDRRSTKKNIYIIKKQINNYYYYCCYYYYYHYHSELPSYAIQILPLPTLLIVECIHQGLITCEGYILQKSCITRICICGTYLYTNYRESPSMICF